MNIPNRLSPYTAGTAQSTASMMAKQRSMAMQSLNVSSSEEEQERSRQRIESIRVKLRAGSTLLPDEMELLKARNPDLYGIAVQADETRRAHMQALRRSESRAEASRMHDQWLILVGNGGRTVDSERTAILVSAVQDGYARYSRSAEYSMLKK